MSSKCNHDCCDQAKIESLVLDDGRRAERHISVDEQGREITEIFAEEKRPLKLEKRILREMKEIVAKEIHQVVKDGEVAYEEVRSLEPEVPLQVRERIGVVDHAKVVEGDYVRKDEISKMIEEGVVAGVSALMESMQQQPIATQSMTKKVEPAIRAQQIVENNVQEKKKNDAIVNVILGGIIVLQLAFFLGYMFLM